MLRYDANFCVEKLIFIGFSHKFNGNIEQELIQRKWLI